MGIDTKPNFSCTRFEQCASDVMNLSGCTQIYGTFDMESGSTLTICDNIGAGKVLTSNASGVATWSSTGTTGYAASAGTAALAASATTALSASTAGTAASATTALSASTAGYADIAGTTLSAGNVSKAINQNSHGFAVKDFIGWSGGTYNKAIADGLYDGEFVGLVSEVPDVDNFNVTQSGFITGLTSLTANTTYFLSESSAGLITDTEPTLHGEISKSVLIANSTTSGWVLPYVGYIISTGSTSISTANNGLTDNGGIVQLGGTLCQSTTIDGDGSHYLYMCGLTQGELAAGNTASCYACVRVVPAGVNLYQSGGTGGIQMWRGPVSTGEGIKIDSNGMAFVDGTNSKGFVYGGNYCAVGGLDPRWIPDAAWVTGQTSVSGCGDYAGNAPATCTVGGITAGAVLTGCTLQCLLQEILAPFIEPTFSAFSVATTCPAEVGSALNGSKSFSWTTTTFANIAAGSIGILDVTSGVTLATGFDYNDSPQSLSIGTKINTSPTTWTWQVSGCSTQGSSFTRNKNVCSIYPYFWGVETSGGRPTVTNDLVTGGSKVVTTVGSSVGVTFNSSNQYTWFAQPTNYSLPRTKWFIAVGNCGFIDRAVPSDRYPDKCTLNITDGGGCWSAVSYEVYMSDFADTLSDPLYFRTY